MPNYNPNTPILFIIFKNPLTMQQVFEKIKNAKPKRLYVASYATLFQFPDIYYQEVKKLLSQIDWDCEVKTLFLYNNAAYFRDPVSWFFSHEEEGIILNDGNLPDDSFFGFCCAMLEKYRNDNRIGHISGTNYIAEKTTPYSYYFSSLVNTASWATWKRVWKTVDTDMLSISRFAGSNAIESNLSYSKYKNDWIGWFMRYVFHREIDAWNVPYTYNNLINNYLSVVPAVNLIEYIGNKNNPDDNNTPVVTVPAQKLEILQYPEFVICNYRADWEEQDILRKAKNKNELSEDLVDGYTFVKNRFVELSKQNDDMKIPRIIHQIYEDPAGVPANLQKLAETWKEQHPTWEYRFWNKKAIEDFLEAEFPDFIPTYHAYPFNVQRWGAVRYLILYRIGGLYVDLDYECLESIDALLNGALCCMGMEPAVNSITHDKSLIVGNVLMASVPNHPYFKAIIKEMIKGEKYSTLPKSLQIMETTGPFMTTRLYEFYPNKEEITLLPAELVAPLTLYEVQNLVSGLVTPDIEDKVEKCFAIHYFGGRWFEQTV
ncbi:hypothetical protein FACS189432_07850 [Bacteroidia bacterium]|nr:hypothetical protein FACS189432_07850 [Bacteroidia bacterium]